MAVSEIWGFVGGLLAAISFSLGIANRIYSRFGQIQEAIAELNGRVAVLEVKLTDLNEDIIGIDHGLKERVEHARTRFFTELEKSTRDLSEENARIKRQLGQVSGFLAKTTNFEPRD